MEDSVFTQELIQQTQDSEKLSQERYKREEEDMDKLEASETNSKPESAHKLNKIVSRVYNNQMKEMEETGYDTRISSKYDADSRRSSCKCSKPSKSDVTSKNSIKENLLLSTSLFPAKPKKPSKTIVFQNQAQKSEYLTQLLSLINSDIKQENQQDNRNCIVKFRKILRRNQTLPVHSPTNQSINNSITHLGSMFLRKPPRATLVEAKIFKIIQNRCQ